MSFHTDNMSVDDGFDALGYRYADSKVAAGESAIHGMRDLWCAVIAQAFMDMGAISPPNSSRGKEDIVVRAECREFDDAARWLLRDNGDFHYICELAGVSPHIIRRAAQVFFGRRQLALGAVHREGEEAS